MTESEYQALTDAILTRLSARSGADQIVLGGYFALRRYIDYRTTHDIDAWWVERQSVEAVESLRAVMEEVAADEGATLRARSWGETLSLELLRGDRRYFSFQVSVRTVTLGEGPVSPWPPLRFESIDDTIGSKMNALVERCAPRDLLDVREIVRRGVRSGADCWALWARKNPGGSVASAKQKVLALLSALELRRPLERINDPAERRSAAELRAWYRDDFLAHEP